MKKDKTFGFRETGVYLTEFENEMKQYGFERQSDYMKALITQARDFQSKTCGIYQKNLGRTARLFDKDGVYFPVKFTNDAEFHDYILKLITSHNFMFFRLLMRPDLLEEIQKISEDNVIKFVKELRQDPEKKAEIEKETPKNEI